MPMLCFVAIGSFLFRDLGAHPTAECGHYDEGDYWQEHCKQCIASASSTSSSVVSSSTSASVINPCNTKA